VGSPTEAGAQAAAAGHVRVRFEVIDTGIGIDAADQERVFASFQQAGSAERRARGVGLGLAIARQLVRLMGGELRLQSKIGLGSRFHFELELPLAAGAQPAAEAGGGGPLLARSVLIVDDIAINIELLRQALAPHVQRCAEATSGEAALALAAEQAFDLILVDVRMPGLDGHETVRRLRRLPLQAAARIVSVSADAFDTSREEALAAGADAYVVKPVDIGKLLQAARRPARGAAHI
jgi:CheY-like chemotaxis protein